LLPADAWPLTLGRERAKQIVEDAVEGYADRVNQLTDPGYTYSLNAGTVHGNGGGNLLIGKPGAATALDLYFAAIGDTTDATAQDTVIGIA
jgi:hypothetical protein